MNSFALLAMKQLMFILKQKYYIENVFLKLPGRTWPPEFLEYLRRMEEEDPTDKWVKSHWQQKAVSAARRIT